MTAPPCHSERSEESHPGWLTEIPRLASRARNDKREAGLHCARPDGPGRAFPLSHSPLRALTWRWHPPSAQLAAPGATPFRGGSMKYPDVQNYVGGEFVGGD